MVPKHDILYVNFYTDGSAARKSVAAFPQAQPRKKTQTVRRKKAVLYLDPVAACSIVVAVVMFIMMMVGVHGFVNARAQAQMMQAYVAQLSEQNDQLETRYREQVNLEQVEQTALALGMVPKDQVQRVSIQVQIPNEQVTSVTMWDQFVSFLTNLFA